MNDAQRLSNLFKNKPLIIVRLDQITSQKILGSRNSLRRFTITQPHDEVGDIKTPTLCISEINDHGKVSCYIGVLYGKAAVSTIDTRLTFIKLRSLHLRSFNKLCSGLPNVRDQRLLKKKLKNRDFSVRLSSKLSLKVIDKLKKENPDKVLSALNDIPNFRPISQIEWEQNDAKDLAKSIFGLSSAESIEESDDDEVQPQSGQAHLLEDNVINADSSTIPGFSFIQKDITGHSTFRKDGDSLDIYTANRGPLEKMLGVDLIYINNSAGSMVMIQYKMLTEVNDANKNRSEVDGSKDWIFRPDKQFKDEISRMQLPHMPIRIDDYRLNSEPFYLKFIKKRLESNRPPSFVISLGHLNWLLKSPTSKGLRGGIRIGYESLSGVYLRETDFVGLIRSGYIGTHRAQSELLRPIIKSVAEGNRALVLAWQQRIKLQNERDEIDVAS